MYHAVGVDRGPGVDPHYAVDLPRFQRHLRVCVRQAGGVIATGDWLQGHAGAIATFDDGHESNFQVAWPALVEVGGRADFFVNPAQVGTTGFATWAELRQMADAGMSVQSHGLDHSHYLTQLSPAQLRAELRQAKLEIEQRVGRPVTLLAPPGGRSPADLQRIAREVGYSHVLNSRPSVIRRGQEQPLGRFAVTAGLEEATLASWLSGGAARLKLQARVAVLDLAKRVLGDRAYERVRRMLLARGGS